MPTWLFLRLAAGWGSEYITGFIDKASVLC